jgi:hypothetical protein
MHIFFQSKKSYKTGKISQRFCEFMAFCSKANGFLRAFSGFFGLLSLSRHCLLVDDRKCNQGKWLSIVV